jgi:environmental stress-induced protein Ves
VVAGPGLGIASGHILVEFVDIAVDSTALAGRFERMEVVVKRQDCMAMCRRIDSTAEEDCTHWTQSVVDTVVATATLDKVLAQDSALLAQDSAPPVRAERIYS